MEASTANVFEALPDEVKQGVADLGWKEPMPVQALAIPALQRGVDLIVQARTGSGKTGAFGLPIVCAVDPALAAPQALVMAPTRELAVANAPAARGSAFTVPRVLDDEADG